MLPTHILVEIHTCLRPRPSPSLRSSAPAHAFHLSPDGFGAACRGTTRGKAKPARFRSVFQGAPPGPLPPSSHVVKEAPNLEPSKASSSGHRGPFARGALQERVRRATNPLQTRAGTGRCVPARSAVPLLICYCWWRCFRLSASSRTTLACWKHPFVKDAFIPYARRSPETSARCQTGTPAPGQS